MRRFVIAVVVVGALVNAPATASAVIVPGTGVGGARLGDTGAKLKSVLGKPTQVQKFRGGESWFWRTSDAKVSWATLKRGRVVGLETSSKGEKTSKGVGARSSLASVKKAYPGIKCHAGVIPTAADTVCTVKTKRGGKTVPTNFVISHKTVTIVDIGEIGEFV